MTSASGGVCPQCQYPGNPAGANFCSRCGWALLGPMCPGCGAPTEVGDRFCTECGEGLRAKGPKVALPGVRSRLTWVSALALIAIVVLVVQQTSTSDIPVASPPSPPPGTLGPTSAIDLDAMTPREAADRLFIRVMTAVESGDQAQAERFLPMAIASYDRIVALTLDDRFHLSLLYALGGDGASALEVAEAGLAVRPTHLLCLAAAAEAALLLENEAQARTHYQALVDVYDEESQAGLVEYGSQAEGGHANLLPLLREEARAYLAGSQPEDPGP